MKIEIKLQPFPVPDSVFEEPRPSQNKGVASLNAFPLSDLSAEALTQLCDRFRADVFVKAGKTLLNCTTYSNASGGHFLGPQTDGFTGAVRVDSGLHR